MLRPGAPPLDPVAWRESGCSAAVGYAYRLASLYIIQSPGVWLQLPDRMGFVTRVTIVPGLFLQPEYGIASLGPISVTQP